MNLCRGRVERKGEPLAPCGKAATWILKNSLGDQFYCATHKAWIVRKSKRQGVAPKFECISQSPGDKS